MPQNRYLENRDEFVAALEKITNTLKRVSDFEEHYKKKYGVDCKEDFGDFFGLIIVEDDNYLKAFNHLFQSELFSYLITQNAFAKEKKEQYLELKSFVSEFLPIVEELDERGLQELSEAIDFYKTNPDYAESIMNKALAS